MGRLWIFDVETLCNIFIVTFYSFANDEFFTFTIDEEKNERKEITEFVKGKLLVGFNNLTFDNIHINYIVKNKNVCALDLYKITQRIIHGQKDPNYNIYKEFKEYLKSDLYESIDLLRLLFSKKLRVSLKELECSLGHNNVQEFEHPFDQELPKERKQELIDYNINDCQATKLVLQKSIEALQLRRWIKNEYDIDAFSMDGVAAGVKILEKEYSRYTGNLDFTKQKTIREMVHIKDIILPFIKFETKPFNKILETYQAHTWYSKHYDEELFEDSGLLYEPLIKGFKFKWSLGGAHGYTQPGIWESNDEYDIISVDVEGFYPSQMIEYLFFPEHLNKEVLKEIFIKIGARRDIAKAAGDTLVSDTLKLARNGPYGHLGNYYSWLFDHQARLAICANGQLMLAMLVEQFFLNDITLIDINTDGTFIQVHKSKKEKFQEIIKWWESVTKMRMEQTKFEKLWFVNTADYFGTYYKKGVLKVKEKGTFDCEEVKLGKGMEFPIIGKAVKKYFLNDIPFEKTIYDCQNILDFCTYKKLSKDATCWHNNKQIQRTNRYYAAKSGAYIFRKSYDDKKNKERVSNLLSESPVIIENRLLDKPMQDRNINYSFYLSSARELVNTINNTQMSMF